MFRERAFLRRWREARRSQKSEDCCVVLTPSISPAQPKKVLGPARPQSRLQMWPRLLCVPGPCQSSGWNQTGLAPLSLGLHSDRLRGPHRARGGKRKNSVMQLAYNYFWTESSGAHPSATSRVTTRRLHNQTLSAVSAPLKIPRHRVRMFFLGTARLRQAEHNDIFRDRPWLSEMQCLWQMSWPTIT